MPTLNGNDSSGPQAQFARQRRRKIFNHWRDQILALVFPPKCVVCDTEIDDPHAVLVCNRCQMDLINRDVQPCPRCAARIPIPDSIGNECRFCSSIDLPIDRAISLGNYHGKLRDVVFQLKRRNQDAVAFQIGRLLGLELESQLDLGSIDVMIPIPSHRSRLFSRGMNPPALLSDGIVYQTGLPIETRILYYRRHTEKQGTLTRNQRFSNVRDALGVRNDADIRDCSVLLVDDVMTSGATVAEAANQLRKSGVSTITAAIVARGVGLS